MGKSSQSDGLPVVQVSAHSGDEEIRLEVLVEYTAAADDANGGPVRGRHLSLPVQLIVQPAIRVRAYGLLGMSQRGASAPAWSQLRRANIDDSV